MKICENLLSKIRLVSQKCVKFFKINRNCLRKVGMSYQLKAHGEKNVLEHSSQPYMEIEVVDFYFS